MIRTSDTDVVVLAVSMAATLPNCELWVAYGTGKILRYMCATQMRLKLGIEKSKVPPMFHVLTGCDTVFFFAGRGKKSAWGRWSVFTQLRDVMSTLMARQEGVEDSMAVINGLSLCCMIAPATLCKSMTLERTYSPGNQGALRRFHRQELRCYNTPNVQCIKPSTSGAKQISRSQSSHRPRSGDGSERASIGNQGGQPYRRLRTAAMSWFTANARRSVEATVNVFITIWTALGCATVVGTASRSE